MDRCYICILHANLKRRAWQRVIKLMIQEMGWYLPEYVFCQAVLLFNLLSSFTVLSHVRWKLKVTKFFHSLSNCICIRVVFVFYKSHFYFTWIIFCKRCKFLFCKYSFIFNNIDKILVKCFCSFSFIINNFIVLNLFDWWFSFDFVWEKTFDIMPELSVI